MEREDLVILEQAGRYGIRSQIKNLPLGKEGRVTYHSEVGGMMDRTGKDRELFR